MDLQIGKIYALYNGDIVKCIGRDQDLDAYKLKYIRLRDGAKILNKIVELYKRDGTHFYSTNEDSPLKVACEVT